MGSWLLMKKLIEVIKVVGLVMLAGYDEEKFHLA